jgi:16S rRNA G966 N2-methylase RsmD
LCTPSLAARAERANLDYLLLDRDARWKSRLGANKFKQFELTEPRQLRFPYDVVFCDPPFSNVEMRVLRRTIDLLAAQVRSIHWSPYDPNGEVDADP